MLDSQIPCSNPSMQQQHKPGAITIAVFTIDIPYDWNDDLKEYTCTFHWYDVYMDALLPQAECHVLCTSEDMEEIYLARLMKVPILQGSQYYEIRGYDHGYIHGGTNYRSPASFRSSCLDKDSNTIRHIRYWAPVPKGLTSCESLLCHDCEEECKGYKSTFIV